MSGLPAPTRDLKEATPARPDQASRRRGITRYELIGALVPLGIVCWVAHGQVLSFDGAMNMQVAHNLAVANVYGRDYGGLELFPPEIQTSSYFLAISALAIALFGTNNLTLQAANLVFVAVLLFAVARAGSPWRLAALFLPSVLLFGTPGLLAYSLGGYGEGTVAALALAAFLLLARALVEPRSAPRMVFLAFLAVGTAISIKTVAVAMVPPALIGVAAAAASPESKRRRTLLATLAAVIPLAAFEVYRAAVLGSSWLGYWRVQIGDIAYQAGGGSRGSTAPSRGFFAEAADHMHLLATQTGIAAEWWATVLVVAPIGAVLVVAWRRAPHPDQLRHVTLVVMLVVYAELYFAWWLFVTPTEKAWLRRVTVGAFALLLALALIAGLLMARLRRSQLISPAARGLTAIGLAATLVPMGFIATKGYIKAAPSLRTDGGRTQALEALAHDVSEWHPTGPSSTASGGGPRPS